MAGRGWLFAEERAAQVARACPRQKDEDENVGGDYIHVEVEGAADYPLVDRVRRHEQSAEDDDERHGDGDPAQDGERMPLPPVARNLPPADVLEQQKQRPQRGAQARRQTRERVLCEARQPQATAVRAQQHEREQEKER